MEGRQTMRMKGKRKTKQVKCEERLLLKYERDEARWDK